MRKSRRQPQPPSLTYRLLLRVVAAENLRHVSSHGTYCKIYVGNADMAVSRKGRQSFKKFLQASAEPKENWTKSRHNINSNASSPSPNSPEPAAGPTTRMREFKTQVQKFSRANPGWNEKFEVAAVDANQDLISLRVKSARLMSSPAVGACCISLHDVPEDETVDRWVKLQDGKKDAGRIRVQIRLVLIDSLRQQQQQFAVQKDSTVNAAGTGEPVGADDGATDVGIGGHTSSSASSKTTSIKKTHSGSVNPGPKRAPSATSSHNSNQKHPNLSRQSTDIKRSDDAAPPFTNDSLVESEHSSGSSSSSYSAGVAPYPVSSTSFISADNDDDDDDDDDAIADPSYSSYRSVDRADRGTMLSEIGSWRSNGSFVGSLHQYNRNSIATSTPSRTTMVMSEFGTFVG